MTDPGAPPRVELTRISPTVERVSIVLEPELPPADTPEVRRVWEEMAAANPRLYNGPVLSVESIDERGATIRVRRDTYRRLVVQPRVSTGVRQLSVTGVVYGIDGRGVSHVLLGRRGTQTRMYPGMWELAPSGGVEPPADGMGTLDHDLLVRELKREALEEVGLEIYGDGVPLAIVYDPQGQSYDVVLKVSAHPMHAASLRGWEYSELRWAPARELRSLEKSMGASLIPPTREIILSIDLGRFTHGESVSI